MKFTVRHLLPLLICMISLRVYANNFTQPDSIPQHSTSFIKPYVFPGILFASGATIAGIKGLHGLETGINERINPQGKHTDVDDYSQFIPGMAVFALDAMGVKGKHKPKTQLLHYGFSGLATTAIVVPMKRIVGRVRPNGSDNHSFPSGHTSIAFASAEFLHQEYGHISPWISVAGYTTAAVTGTLRMYNNEHWLGDVLAGAAIGMATTKLVYWVGKGKWHKARGTSLTAEGRARGWGR